MIHEPLNVTMAGELDCGKSTLIGRLLLDTHSLSKEKKQDLVRSRDTHFAHLLDSLSEERNGQFTLDTTQAFIRTRKRHYILIDVPGHRELLKNMLTGASYADVAILVVDVQKGLEEQTKRHLYLLKFLGIDSIILAINKMDTVNYKKEIFQQVSDTANSFLKKIQIDLLCVIPISGKKGEGLLKKSKKMPWYQGNYLLKAIDTCMKRKRPYEFRFPIQDVYKIKNETIIVGNVLSGEINTKDSVRMLPLDKELKVKKIKVFNERLKNLARPPQSIGLELDDMQNLKRGHILYKGIPPRFTSLISAKIFCIMPLGIEERLTLHCSTQAASAKISQINTAIETADFNIRRDVKALKATDAAEISITLDKPIATEDFKKLPQLGRFVLLKDSKVCAIGIIL